MTSTTMTIRVPLDVSTKLAKLAAGTHRSRSWLAAAAVSTYVDRELAIIDGIQKGLADVEAGRTTSHDEVMEQARQIVADARGRREKER